MTVARVTARCNREDFARLRLVRPLLSDPQARSRTAFTRRRLGEGGRQRKPEASVTLRTRILGVACIAGAVLTTLPEPAEAQRRTAVRAGVGVGTRGVRPRATVIVRSSRYRPAYYSAWGPWGYDSWYSPYAYAQFPYYGYRYDDSASLRLQVNPKQTEVFVDGYFAGTVDDFDGVLQRLHLEPGDHDIELYLAGHRTHVQRVYLQPHKTFRIRHDMRPLAAGEAEPSRPEGEPLPRRSEDDDYDSRSGPDERRRAPGTGPGPEPRGDREPPSASRGDAGFGSIALRVQPADAEVMIDGDKWQSAPGERLVVELSAGPHRIEIRKEGYRTYMTEITVRPGATASLNVAMTRAN